MTKVRRGQSPRTLTRAEFDEQFRRSYYDPAFRSRDDAIDELEPVAWANYSSGRKAPVTEKAGREFADPEYALSVEWRATRQKLLEAEANQRSTEATSRVLLIVGSPRNDGSCPGEMSKSYRLAELAREVLVAEKFEIDLLDLSLLTSEYGRRIFPCKGCVSTAMPLCHWPCSCYPNHALAQTGDWMSEIYEKWVSAHGIIIVTPVHWYQVPSVLKLMIDRLVCADGGNPDPTTTSGKDAEKAKALELAGWPYPKHLAGRIYGLLAHGDVGGAEAVRRALSDWLDWMGLVNAGPPANLDRMIGYYEPYASSHEALDANEAVQEEMRNVARAVVAGVRQMRSGKPVHVEASTVPVRPK